MIEEKEGPVNECSCMSTAGGVQHRVTPGFAMQGHCKVIHVFTYRLFFNVTLAGVVLVGVVRRV
ncbi:hypothetical protein [Streptomyces sp. CT34]|uniref:hypothetical protein n=1 Tax=Streptomyces sp. CT34 TaxID=1553907 RepID=UPI0012FEB2E4|nr:hypothetical protein [Streptomyces sp. CT34]